MKFCQQCNTNYEEDIGFCPKHGVRLQKISRTHIPSQRPPSADGSGNVGGVNLHGRTQMDGVEEGMPLEEDEPDLTGQVVARRYRVSRRLGEGGMGVVYAAVDERLEKEVAIKVLREDFARRTDVVARFTQEAKSAARIKHENVLDVTDYGQTDEGGFYIAMELLSGTDLAELLRVSGTVPFERALDIALQVCRALSAAHGKGIVHRDLKPENVFLVHSDDAREVVKIVDFGIAQMKDISGGAGASEGKKLTRTGMIFGTPEYMSPEQAAGKSIDHRVDVYATGVILYEMFSGRVPFVGETFMGVLTQHMFEPVPPITEVNPEAVVSQDLEAVIAKALAKKPDDRYASMQELAEDLQRLRAGARPSAPFPPVASVAPQEPRAHTTSGPSGVVSVGVARTIEAELPNGSRRGLLLGAVVAGVAVLAAVAAVAGMNNQPEPTSTHNPPRTSTHTGPEAPPRTVPEQHPAALTPTPVVTDAGPPRVTVHFEVQPAATLRITTADHSPVEACEPTPCDRVLLAGVPVQLVATSGRRRVERTFTPSPENASLTLSLGAASNGAGRDRPGRPGGAQDAGARAPANANANANGNPAPQRRCGYNDPNTGLMIPCL